MNRKERFVLLSARRYYVWYVTINSRAAVMTMKMKKATQPSVLGELALWLMVGIFSTAMALVAMLGAKYILGWSEVEWLAGSIVIGLGSLTWGSWAALLWTRSRVLKTMMLLIVLIPGLVMLVLGGWAFLTIPDNPFVGRWGWAIVAAHGAGALAVVALLGGPKVFASVEVQELRPRQLVIGWTLYPVVVAGAGLLVVVAAFFLMPDLFVHCGATAEKVVSQWVVVSQAAVLLTTVLPAAASTFCDRLTRASVV